MRERILAFLADLDADLAERAGTERLDLFLIGKAAIILFYGGEEAGAVTADVDVVQVSHPASPLLALAIERFGKGTPAARRHGLYLEGVLTEIPPLPGGFRKRCVPMPGEWRALDVWQPEAHDLAASKLKRYASKDKQDLQHLCDKGLIDGTRLREALESAFEWHLEKDGDPNRDRAFANLARVVAYLDGTAASL